MFATFKANFHTKRQKSLPLHCVARAFFMSVTYLLYMAGSTIRAYIVMVYASLLVLSFEQRCGGYPPLLYPHKCSIKIPIYENRKRNAGYELATVL